MPKFNTNVSASQGIAYKDAVEIEISLPFLAITQESPSGAWTFENYYVPSGSPGVIGSGKLRQVVAGTTKVWSHVPQLPLANLIAAAQGGSSRPLYITEVGMWLSGSQGSGGAHAVKPAVLPSVGIRGRAFGGASNGTLLQADDTSGTNTAYDAYHQVSNTGMVSLSGNSYLELWISGESGANSQANSLVVSRAYMKVLFPGPYPG